MENLLAAFFYMVFEWRVDLSRKKGWQKNPSKAPEDSSNAPEDFSNAPEGFSNVPEDFSNAPEYFLSHRSRKEPPEDNSNALLGARSDEIMR